MDRAEAINIATRYADLLKINLDFNRLILFGSYAKGTSHEDSDIDIAIVFNDFEDPIKMQVDLMKFRRKIDSRIEPHPFRERDFNKSNPVVNEILRYGYNINKEKIK